jgi:glycosyltransferase involved in cell wall biosynthesis
VDSADITFVILTRDEAANIGACLASLPTASRAIVYDAQSQDGTAGIARAAGAAVTSAPWRGFKRSREAAARLVTTPWTFMLDADERISPDLRAALQRLRPGPDVGGYSMPRRNHFCGRWIRSAGWWPDRLVRLFRTGKARLVARGPSSQGVHETWHPDGECRELAAPIEHYSYDSPAAYRRKFALYTDLEASGARGTLTAAVAAWLIVPARFAWYWLRRGGVFEGWRGAFVCAGNAAYPAVVATKSWLRSGAPGDEAGV